jgi:hypothetical protein
MRIIFSILFMVLNLLMIDCANAADPPSACAVLSEKEALALTGGPLREVIKNEKKPTDENGSDHSTACGYFPKGYNFEKAEGPPERGIMITLHNMPSKEAAKRYYNGLFDMVNMPGATRPGDKITPVSGLGEAAYLKVGKVGLDSSGDLADIGFLKGNVMGLLQVWAKRPPGETAQSAAKQIISKLP